MNITEAQIEQIEKFRYSFIEHDEIKKIFSIFDSIRLDKSINNEPESMLLTGETGVGKTALINHYLSKHKSSHAKHIQPILSTRVPSQSKAQDVLAEFLIDLQSLSLGRVSKRSQTSLIKGVIRTLKENKTELVIVNEIQELIEHSTPREKLLIVNTLKHISEDAKVPFVLVGMPYAKEIATEPQWNSRLGWQFEINYFRLVKIVEKKKSFSIELDVDQKKHFAQFLIGLAESMGYEEPPVLAKNEILYPLFATCQGQNRKLKNFLKEAMKISFIAGKNCLDKDDLSKTFSFKFPQETNPFECRLDEITFSQIAQNSIYNATAVLPSERILPPKFTDRLSLSEVLSKNSKRVIKA